MKKLLFSGLLVTIFSVVLFAQQSIPVGYGSYAEYPPTSVYEEGAYFGLTYNQLQEGWPWYIHADKQDQPIPTNDWWTATIFEKYTGNLEVYPHRVEGTANGVRVSLPTSYAMFDSRGLSVTMGTSVSVKGAVSLVQDSNTEIFADFESATYPAGWTVSSNPPYPGPVSLADFDQSPTPQGFLGDRFINTYAGDGPQMTLTSPNFTISKKYIHFLFGGGNNIDLNYIGLYINGVRIMAKTGENSANLNWGKFDVTNYIGQTAHIRIVDLNSGGWGFTLCDNIVFSNDEEVSSSFSNSFWPQDAKAYDWSDLGFVFRLEDNKNHIMDASVYHGVPYTFIDLKDVDPIIEASSAPTGEFTSSGSIISSFPYHGNTIVIEVDGKLFGIHAPNGTQFQKSPAGNYIPNIPANAPQYLVISVIPNTSLISTYDGLARNKITKSAFNWSYNEQTGVINTSFDFTLKNYENGATNGQTLLSLQPHHYRNTSHPAIISGADYQTMYGLMQTSQGKNFTISYNFGGMPPYLPQPQNLDENQKTRLNDLLSTRIAVSEDYNGNTYAKGFGEESNIMLMARELGHPGYETIKNNMKNELINWLTYETSEASEGRYFFAEYPQFGALIGWPSGYGSQAFNDLHFHYGYFVTGAARLMLVDEDFKAKYGDMVKRVAKSYANWKRFGVNDNDKQPFLRNFDPYVGHSWAGGIGSGADGNNQESTSEAMHSWMGIYLLGIALDDQEILSLGATGFLLEGITSQYYWFDRYGDMPDEYPFDYVGILKANNMAMATFFDGDPAWAFGIQAVPCDFFYEYYLGAEPQKAASDFTSMLNDRVNFNEIGTADPYANIAEMGAYLGNYHLNYVQSYDPVYAANMLDQLMDQEGGDWLTHINSATNYYVANANVTYGSPAEGYRTSIATGGVFKNDNDELAVLIYNYKNSPQNVNVYHNGSVIETINVGPKEYYNSKGIALSLTCSATTDLTNLVNKSVVLNATGSKPGSTFVWIQESGPSATIEDSTSASTVITFNDAGVYTFKVTVKNGAEECSLSVNFTYEIQNECSLISLNKPVVASGNEGDYVASRVNDGSLDSRWSSEFYDDQWIRMDLGENYSICEVQLHWEGAYGKKYEIRLGDTPDVNEAEVVAAVQDGNGGVDIVTIDQSHTGRYLWMYGIERATPWGYSLWEMEVYGSVSQPKIPPTADAGSNLDIPETQTSFTLNGSGTDVDGTIVSYKWTQISGPSSSIGNSNAEVTTVNHTGVGIYVYKLTVTDNDNLTGSDEVIVTVSEAAEAGNIALGKIAFASSHEGGFDPSNICDGDLNTRWGSDFSDPQWVGIDLGKSYSIDRVKIYWETAYGKAYRIDLSDDENFNSFETIHTVTNSDGGIDELNISSTARGRYIRVYGTERGTGWGYSIWEMEVYAKGSSSGSNPTSPANVSASAIKYAVTISWNHSSDASGIKEYRIYEGAIQRDLVSGANNSLTISGLTPDTEYTFCVVAVNNVDNTSTPSCVTFRTQADGQGNDPNLYDGIGNIALGTLTEHSSVGGGGTNVSANAVDGIMNSRWESAFDDNEWMIVDLGLRYRIGRYIIHWETASGRHYKIQVSDDKVNWTDAYEFNGGELPVESRFDDFSFPEKDGRYVRFLGLERNTSWSYSIFEFELYSPGSGPDDVIEVNPCPDPLPIIPEEPSFLLSSPSEGAVITNTRRPTLNWQSTGAQRYEVWVNITKTDYDWHACGSLLDRFTKVGETSSASFTFSEDLPDRWTYKWYIKAINGSSTTYSNLGQFSLYLPIVEKWNDGVDIINGCRDMNKNGTIEPYEDWRNPIDVRINDLMSRMTLEEKAYQMFYNAQAFPQAGWAFGPGTVHDMFNKQKASAATRLGIPFVSAGDCIHGYSTTYPTQSGLAASRNLDIVREVGDMQRAEQLGVGFRGSLSPLAEVGTKVIYPRIQEGCGEDAEFASAMIRAMVCGMQGGPELNPKSILVTTKHWPGEGAGGEGGITYDAVSIKYHMRPWFANVEAGAGSVMPGYAGSNFLDPSGKGAGDSKPILDYLRDVVGFEGAICTDWLPWGAWVDAANAGADILGGADPGASGFSMSNFIAEVGEARINDAVRRILDIKFRLGVFEDPYGDPDLGQENWFSEKHQNIAIDAARQSMTLLENNGVLPLNLPPGSNLLVTGSRANDGSSYSIWTSYFHAQYGAKTMYEAIHEKAQSKGINVSLDNASNPSAAIVIVGEPSYTHATAWDKEKPYFHDAYFPISNKQEYDLTKLREVEAMGIPYVVVVIMPRPYILTDVVDKADATLLAYRPGDGGGPALAQILFGEFPPSGRLPWQLPRSMDQIGTDDVGNQLERWDLPFDLGATVSERQEIKRLIIEGIQPQPIYGNPLYQYGYGIQGYTKSSQGYISPQSDLQTDTQNDDDEDSVKMNIYPNPVTNNMNVSIQGLDLEGSTYKLYNMFGHVILNGTVDSKTDRISLSLAEMNSGSYLFMIIKDGRVYSKIFVKN